MYIVYKHTNKVNGKVYIGITGDEYYEWSMKCLRRNTWRQFKIAKMMLKNMKENPYKFPEE